MRDVWAAALGILVIATGCGTVHVNQAASTSPSAAYVPWLALPRSGVYPQAPPASPTPPTPIPEGTPACTSAQIEAVQYGSNGASENVTTPVLFRNRSDVDCYLDGYPDVSIVSAFGNILAKAVGASDRGTYFDNGNNWVVPILMKTGTTSLATVLQAREPVQGQAWINVEWFVCNNPPTASRMIIDLPSGGGRLNISYDLKAAWNGECVNPSIAAGLSRGQFTPTGTDGWPPSGAYISVDISIDAPPSVKHGSTLTYYVTVTNTSTLDYELNPCPDYNEFLGSKLTVESYQLNCAPAGRVGPGASVRFQMKLMIPSTVAPGPSSILWALSDGRLATPVATAPIVIS